MDLSDIYVYAIMDCQEEVAVLLNDSNVISDIWKTVMDVKGTKVWLNHLRFKAVNDNSLNERLQLQIAAEDKHRRSQPA